MQVIYEEKQAKRGLNKKKIIGISVILLCIIIAIVLFSFYVANASFRLWMDQYIFRKNISSENLPSVAISTDNTGHIFAYENYIAVLNQTKLTAYDSSGKVSFETDVSINNPIYDISGRYLCLAEENGQKLYVMSGQNILWQTDVEGQITKVTINKNGYVSIVVSGTSYKTVVITYSPTGTELFKTNLSKTIAADISMSSNNKYLAIAEIDTSKSQIQSNIRIVSLEKASSDPANAVIYIYPASAGEIITDIYYQYKDRLVCMYDTSIHLIEDNSDQKIMDIDSKTNLFCNIQLQNHISRVIETSSGLFANIQVQITDITSQKESIYAIESLPKSVEVFENTIAVNLGTEVHFIDTNGWLIKKYSSSEEIKDIVLSSHVAGIIYKDKIEFISL